jgi:hypothetical protein
MAPYIQGFTYVESGDLLVSTGVLIEADPIILFLQGNGETPFLVTEAYYQQGTRKAYITCNGKRSFYVPALGRFTDPVTFSGFTIPGYAYLNHTISGFVPTGIDEQPTLPVTNADDSNVTVEHPTVTPPITPPYVAPPEYEVNPPILASKCYTGIAASEDGNVIYVCSQGAEFGTETLIIDTNKRGGLFKSLDRGITWIDITPPNWFGWFLPHVACDSTGSKVALTSCSYDARTAITKDTLFSHTAKYDGCVLISNDGGSTWKDHWPGFGYNPGVYAARDVLYSHKVTGNFTIGSGYDFNYYNSLTGDDYSFLVLGFNGNARGAYCTVVWDNEFDPGSYIGSVFHSYVRSASYIQGYAEKNYAIYDWYIIPAARKLYTSLSMSNDGQVILVTTLYDKPEYNKNAGHYISTDGGLTWSVPNFGTIESVPVVLSGVTQNSIDNNSDTILVSTSTGVLVSTNTGTSFDAVAKSVYAITVSGDGNTVYCTEFIDGSIVFNRYDSILQLTTASTSLHIPIPTDFTTIAPLNIAVNYDGTMVVALTMAIVLVDNNITDAEFGIAVSRDSGETWATAMLDNFDSIPQTGPPLIYYFNKNLKLIDDNTAVVLNSSAGEIIMVDLTTMLTSSIGVRTRSTSTVTGHCIGTITVTDNSKIDVGETITIDGVVYTFVAFLTGADNEILIGLNDDLTAINIAATLNNTYGSLIIATVTDNVVTVDYLTDTMIEWSTTSDGITLSGLTLYFEYTYDTDPATLTGMTSTGYAVDSGTGGILPSLTADGTSTHSAFVIPYNNFPSLRSTGHSYQTPVDSSSTAAEKVAILSCDNGWLEWYAGLITDPSATNDENVLLMTQYVGCYLTYVADTVDEWKDPQQTIADGYGDCEDGSILLFSLLVNFGISSSRVRVYTGEIDGVGHAWVAYLRESDNKWITLDWTLGTPWVLVTSLDQVPKTYFDDYWLYTDINSYFSCGTYTEVNTLDEYIASVVGISTNELEYPEYTIEATMDSHISGEIEYPEYEVSGYTGATTESDEPYDELNYPDYTIEATGYGNSIGHNIAFDYPDYIVTGTVFRNIYLC